MDTSAAPKFLFIFLISINLINASSTGMLLKQQEFQREEHQKLHPSRKELQVVEHEFFNFPTATSSGTITVPSASSPPVTVSPVNNPVTTPAPPTTTTNAPGQQSWCVARNGVDDKSIQAALNYACGIGKADCSAIQQGASCYNPNTLQNHASFAFNSYYQRNPLQTSCDFGGAATLTNSNPSSGSCIFTTSASSASPTTASPITTTPTPTPTGSSAPPTTLNAGNPGFGEAANTSSVSWSSSLQPFTDCSSHIIIVVTSIITAGTVFHV